MDEKNSVLYIGVDLQNDFMNRTGALYVPGAEKIKSSVEYLMGVIHASGAALGLTADMHDPMDEELSTSPDYQTTFPPHCISGTHGADFIDEIGDVDELGVDADVHIFEKDRFSVFTGNQDFGGMIVEAMKKFKVIVVFGVAGDVCVKALLDGLLEVIPKNGCPNICIETEAIASLKDDDFFKYRVGFYKELAEKLSR